MNHSRTERPHRKPGNLTKIQSSLLTKKRSSLCFQILLVKEMVLDLLHRIDLSNAETSLSNPKIFCQGTGHHGAVHGFSGCYRMLSASSFLFSLQCEGKAYNDRSDIWAMGCILYEMACPQKTFEGSNLPALVNKIMKVGFIHGSESLAFAFPCLRVWWCNVFVQHEAQCTLDTSMQISRQFL